VRIWDVAAGYLNQQSLLAEHRELHGLRSILLHDKKGYSRHPETLRWVGCLSALARRHRLLAAEMRVRGYVDRTPVPDTMARSQWPVCYVTEPGEQFALLRKKYIGKAGGRIPLPRSIQELWASHKYSVMARDPETYRVVGRRVAGARRFSDPSRLAKTLVELLREPPTEARLVNALEHMWGHVAQDASDHERRDAHSTPHNLVKAIQRVVARTKEPFLSTSTALSELEAFLDAA
jgi:pyrimidine dimer DNA glycosylase/uncharacterized protein DUF1722